METGERLSTYLAGELDLGERAEVEAELARDPALREQLDRIERANRALGDLGEVAPRPGFSERLHQQLEAELATTPRDELAARRTSSAAWRPLVTAAAAAVVLVVVGLGGGYLLRGGGADNGDLTMEAMTGGSGVIPVATDNDYDERELRRLAFGINLNVPATMDPAEAEAAAEVAAPAPPGAPEPLEANGTVGGGSSGEGSQPGSDETSDSAGTFSDTQDQQKPGGNREERAARRDDEIAACLPQLTENTEAPVVLVYVELAKYDGQRAIIYVFAALDPETDQYRRAEVWAIAPGDCSVLGFAQYDQPPRPGS